MLKPAARLGAVALSLALSAPVIAAEPSAETVVATVNGVDITLGHMIALRESLPPQYLQLDDETLFNGILDQIIQQAALAEAAEADMDTRDELFLDNQRRSYLAGTTLEETAASAVTDEAVQSLYDEKYANTDPGTEYNAAHILVATEDEAKAIKAELDGGADFAVIAKEKSTDRGSAEAGGDLGWFGVGMMVKPFEDAVLAMEAGTVSDPVQSDFGWHLIKLNETRAATAPTIEDVRAELESELQGSAVEAKVTELTEAAKVEKMVEGIDPAILKNTALIEN
ncbi:peptidylprolyl isomerase [Defluviimonas sp. WL0024]|uniref:Parvulin-like PPIase n=1 Tax=Albidovulum salinarum TaxID=2984153 RepID=A0ABT2X360_9RHOB|nr:peptidylprolyl isomerase [Defluviimonas sp. WL0024]MCU9848149.1 peptidylprolyl isomerase [Defluviimonas sp. WL0024]